MLDVLLNSSIVISAMTAIVSAVSAYLSLQTSRQALRILRTKEGSLPSSPDVEAPPAHEELAEEPEDELNG